MSTVERLKRRNELWRQLRAAAPDTPGFEATLADLRALTGWTRAQVLAGLGFRPADVPDHATSD